MKIRRLDGSEVDVTPKEAAQLLLADAETIKRLVERISIEQYEQADALKSQEG